MRTWGAHLRSTQTLMAASLVLANLAILATELRASTMTNARRSSTDSPASTTRRPPNAPTERMRARRRRWRTLASRDSSPSTCPPRFSRPFASSPCYASRLLGCTLRSITSAGRAEAFTRVPPLSCTNGLPTTRRGARRSAIRPGAPAGGRAARAWTTATAVAPSTYRRFRT